MTADLWYPAYVGLGSNLDDPEAQVRSALAELEGMPRCVQFTASSLYRCPPMGPQEQPDYVNAVTGFLTQLPSRDLMQELLRVEKEHGRSRDGTRWGPRTLDLDLLVYANQVIEEEKLTVPHPGVHERNFVLYPLMEIAPALLVPGQGRVAELAARLGSDDLRRI